MLIARARRRTWTHATKKLEASGETMVAWQMLLHLIRNGQRSQTELAQLTAQHPAGVSRALDDLEKRGRIKRRRDPQDRRRVYVVASASGKRWFAATSPVVLSAVNETLEPLSVAERRILRLLLRKVLREDVP